MTPSKKKAAAKKKRAARSATPRRTRASLLAEKQTTQGETNNTVQAGELGELGELEFSELGELAVLDAMLDQEEEEMTRPQLTAIVAALVYTKGGSMSPDDCVSVAEHILTAANVPADETPTEDEDGQER